MLKKSQKRTVIAISALALIGFGALVVNNYKTKTSLKYNEENNAAIKPQENPQDAVAAAVNDDAAAIAETRKNSDLLKIPSFCNLTNGKDCTGERVVLLKVKNNSSFILKRLISFTFT